jgi:glycosyltransferase involved in cell wall biosynthesis
MSGPRVLFVSRTRYSLPLSEGVARKWDELEQQLDVRVLASAVDGMPASDERFHLVGTPRLPWVAGGAFYAALPVRIACELRQFHPKVVVAQSPFEGAAALLARRLMRSPTRVVVEIHGDWRTATRLYGSRVRRLAEPLSELVARNAVQRADAVRTVGPFTTGLVRGLGVEPAATFTTFSELSAFTGRPLSPLPNRPTLLFIGVLERYKDVRTLAAAWRLVAPRIPDARLRMVGRGRERDLVERLMADLPRQTTWSELLPPEDVAAALDDATALVLPSRSEGLPRVAIEAFARGRPVVGSAAGGIPDIVEHDVNGLLVTPGDASALAKALEALLTDRALAERLAAGAAESSAAWVEPAEGYPIRMRALVDAVAG